MKNENLPVKDVTSAVIDAATEVEQTLETPADTKQAKVARWLSFAGILLKALVGIFAKKS